MGYVFYKQGIVCARKRGAGKKQCTRYFTSDPFFEQSKNPSTFWDRLDLLCKEDNLTYCQISELCHFDKNYISRWIKKRYIASLEMLEILADHFNVTLDYLLGRTDYRK